MECIAKIFLEYQLEGSQLWKYNFLNVETNQGNFFYYDKQIGYNPNVVGNLSITKDKFFQSFEQDLTNTGRESIGEQFLTDFEKQSINSIEKISKKHKNVSVELEHLKNLRELGFSYKDLATIYKRSERTIFRWFKLENKQLQKRGCKPKFKWISREIIAWL